MAKLSISNAWDQSRAILSRDMKLFAAVALALIVLPGTISDLVTPAAPPGELPEPGAWMLVALAAMVIGLVGQLAIARLAATSGLTVADSIRHGAKRMPSYLASILLWVLPFALVLTLLMPHITPAQPKPAAALAFLIVLGLALFIFVRLSPAVAVASQEGTGPLAILKRSWALTRGNWWRLFGFLLICIAALLVLFIAVGAVVGTVVGLFTGGEVEPMSIAALVIALVTQMVTSMVTVVFVVMLARIYVQLSAAPGTGLPEVKREG